MENYFWQEYLLSILLSTNVHDIPIRIENSRVLLMFLKKSILSNKFYNLASGITDVSSVDRIVEKPNNILTESKCYLTLHKCLSTNVSASLFHNIGDYGSFVQRKCCVMNDPCYWSSAPNNDPSNYEYVAINLVHPVCLVAGFTITPYQAFFHPFAPTYAPKEVCLQFLRNDDPLYNHCPYQQEEIRSRSPVSRNNKQKAKTMAELQEGVYFSSKYYPVKKSFEHQAFYFDRPQLCYAGIVRLVFRGFAQRQTLDSIAGQDFYICISYASIIGLPFVSHTTKMPVEHPQTVINEKASDSGSTTTQLSVFKDTPTNLVTLFYDKHSTAGGLESTSLIRRMKEDYDVSSIQAKLGDRLQVISIKDNLYYSFLGNSTDLCEAHVADNRKTGTPSQEQCCIF